MFWILTSITVTRRANIVCVNTRTTMKCSYFGMTKKDFWHEKNAFATKADYKINKAPIWKIVSLLFFSFNRLCYGKIILNITILVYERKFLSDF